MTVLTIDGNVLRQARLTSGNSRVEVARIAGVSSRTLMRIEENSASTSREITLDRLTRLAAAVAIDPLRLLGRQEETADLSERGQRDAARLVAALGATSQPLRAADLIAVFEWSPARFEDAVVRANKDLATSSLLVAEGARGLRLQPAHSTGHDDAAKAIAALATLEGLDASYVKVLHRFWSGKVRHPNPGRRAHSSMALLSRLGLLQAVHDSSQYRVTDALRFAFPDSDEVPPTGTG